MKMVTGGPRHSPTGLNGHFGTATGFTATIEDHVALEMVTVIHLHALSGTMACSRASTGRSLAMVSCTTIERGRMLRSGRPGILIWIATDDLLEPLSRAPL